MSGGGVAVSRTPPVVCFVAWSGTGKTTLIEKVIAALKERGWRVGALKHDAHDFEIDRPGKDSYRFSAAGAEVTVIASDTKMALVRQCHEAPRIDDLLGDCFAGLDIVVTEGFKHSSLPKIEVHRAALGRGLLTRGEHVDAMLVAVVSDEKLLVDVPVLDLDRVQSVIDFIETEFLHKR